MHLVYPSKFCITIVWSSISLGMTVGLCTSCSATFWQLLVFRATFCILSNFSGYLLVLWKFTRRAKGFPLLYSWLPITRTLANSNQNRFPLDFRHTFTVILPSVTRTLDNSNLPLTRRNSCFPSDHFYVILPLITRTMFWALKKSWRPRHWIFKFLLRC